MKLIIYIDGYPIIQQIKEYKFLGIIIIEIITFEKHIEYIYDLTIKREK